MKSVFNPSQKKHFLYLGIPSSITLLFTCLVLNAGINLRLILIDSYVASVLYLGWELAQLVRWVADYRKKEPEIWEALAAWRRAKLKDTLLDIVANNAGRLVIVGVVFILSKVSI